MKTVFRKTSVFLVTCLLLCAIQANAALIVIDFEADTVGAKPNDFAPAGIAGVTFSDTVGQDLWIDNFGVQGAGQRSLYVGTDQDLSALRISLGFMADSFSLDFGNDDPRFNKTGDQAVLTLFAGTTQVGQSIVALNLNDLMDQTIAFGSIGGSILFNNMTFAFTDRYFNLATGGGSVNVGAAEVVDNIRINSVDSPVPVPEPGTIVLLGSGLIGAASFMRRHRRAG